MDRMTIRFALILLAILPTWGCGGYGGLSQEEMKRRAIRRVSDDDEPLRTSAGSVEGALSSETSTATEPDGSADVADSANAAPILRDVPPAVTQHPANAAGVSTSREAEEAGDATLEVKGRPVLDAVQRHQRSVKNLGRIGAALERYLAEKGAYPAATIHYEGRPLLSWRVTLLPYLGYEALYQQFRLGEPWNSPHNVKLLDQIPEPYQSPERFDDRTNYLAVVGNAYALSATHGRTIKQFEDGASNTVIVVEAGDDASVPWTEPRDFEPATGIALNGLQKLRADGILVLWGGGTVGLIPADITAQKAYAMFSREGGESFLFTDVHRDPLSMLAHAKDTRADVTPRDNLSDPSELPSNAGERSASALATEQRLAGSSHNMTSREKAPVPDSVTYDAILEKLREVYEPTFRAARRRSDRMALARSMYSKAEELANDPETRFVMFRVVASIAAEAGDIQLMTKALERLNELYDGDLFSLWVEALRVIAKADVDTAEPMIDAALNAAEEAAARDDFELARELHSMATACARESSSQPHAARIVRVRRDIETARRRYQQLLHSLEKLEHHENDPEANATIGKYYCFAKRQWERGLPFLLKASDLRLVEAARAEQAGPVLPEELVDAGDRWWEYAASNRSDERDALLRAGYWYLRALSQSRSGLPAIKAEVRVKQLEQTLGVDAIRHLHEQLTERGNRRFTAAGADRE